MKYLENPIFLIIESFTYESAKQEEFREISFWNKKLSQLIPVSAGSTLIPSGF